MVTFRCTKKLLARLGPASPGDDVEPTTRLGDWYANLLFTPGAQVVLAVSERTLLPVLITASPATTIIQRLRAVVKEVLLRVGVPTEAVEAELEEMEQVRIGRTASRQVLGSMNDFAFLMEVHMKKNVRLIEEAVRLAHTPCGPIGMKYPVDLVLELLRPVTD